ncbi:hypothetical protein PCASD_11211 [Puccinia coronata f. sp. avenae]|uniref:Symplekin/Pta1 N-terminal domain-containing protein n=1 Tax=Puccinia coronata f. sp. avenae TaxID=200324 RepID=A0A2N5UFG5_9BASI|nr:hypothetical protein PCASD_11211 [Puccinia coronata f. sp. avenae]
MVNSQIASQFPSKKFKLNHINEETTDSNPMALAGKPPSATPNDCLALFSSAISAPPGSITQRSTLSRLRELLDLNPAFIPILYPSLLALIAGNATHQLCFRPWIASIIQLAISKTALSPDQRLQIVLQSTETIHRLITLQDPSDQQLIQTKKLAIQAFSSAYPILFKHVCTKSTTTNDSKQWGLSNQIKGTILSLWRNENSPLGIRLAANKFVQRVIQVGTRGLIDPRKRNEDPSIVMCGSSSSAQQHPYLKPKELEQEANNLLEESTRIMFQSKIPELVAAIVVSLGSLVRLRPSLSPIIMVSLANYNPSNSPLVSRTVSVLQLKGIEKTLRITLSHLDRTTPGSPYTQQIREALLHQTKRIEELNEKERERKRLRKEEAMGAKKRARLDQRPDIQEIMPPPPQIHPTIVSTNQLPGFDVTSLPLELVAELVIANLQVLSDQALNNAINAYLCSVTGERTNASNEPTPMVQTLSNHTQLPHQMAIAPPPDRPHFLPPGSPVRPKMEIDSPSKADTETYMHHSSESSHMNALEEPPEDDGGIDEEELVLQPNPDLEEGEAEEDRIVSNGLLVEGCKVQSGVWSMLLSRLVTRGMSDSGTGSVEEIEMRKEDIRQSLFQFVIADFPNRMHFARAWLMEEWLAKPTDPHQFDRPTDLMHSTPYERWLAMTLDYIVNNTACSNPTQPESTRPLLSGFVLDLPFISERELMRLQQMCQDPTKITVAFSTLRDLTTMRPTLRNRTLDSWVSPNNTMNHLGERVVSFAVQLLQKLEKNEEDDNENNILDARAAAAGDGTSKSGLVDQPTEVEMEDGETTELEAAGREMSPEPPVSFAKVQNAVILSGLRGRHAKIISLIQNCEAGSEALVLRILSILTEKGKPPAGMIEAIKSLASKSSDLSPRFIIPMMGELSKSEIMHHLPRILTLLNGKPDEKNLVRSVLESIIQQPRATSAPSPPTPPASNSPNYSPPVELLVLIHRSEDAQYSIKQAIEAIGLCFSMTEVFKPEVLAAFMQQVVDELTLPTLFLRTVIQAVQTYKSLQAFVSTTLLSRLILKKIWTQPSSGRLHALRQDHLAPQLRRYPPAAQRSAQGAGRQAGNNKSRVTTLLEILSDTPHSPKQEGMLSTGPATPTGAPMAATTSSSASSMAGPGGVADTPQLVGAEPSMRVGPQLADEPARGDDELRPSSGPSDPAEPHTATDPPADSQPHAQPQNSPANTAAAAASAPPPSTHPNNENNHGKNAAGDPSLLVPTAVG